jgi:hypothetical protein
MTGDIEFTHPPDRVRPFLNRHCHQLAVALRARLGGCFHAIVNGADWPEDEEDFDTRPETLINEGRIDHVFVEVDGIFIDAKGAYRDVGSIVIREYWPGGELGTFISPLDPEHIEMMIATEDYTSEPHQDTEALADEIVSDLIAANMITAQSRLEPAAI